MESEVTPETVEAARAAMLEAKKGRRKSTAANRSYQAKATAFASARQRWRLQEVAANRRPPGVGVSTQGGSR